MRYFTVADGNANSCVKFKFDVLQKPYAKWCSNVHKHITGHRQQQLTYQEVPMATDNRPAYNTSQLSNSCIKCDKWNQRSINFTAPLNHLDVVTSI